MLIQCAWRENMTWIFNLPSMVSCRLLLSPTAGFDFTSSRAESGLRHRKTRSQGTRGPPTQVERQWETVQWRRLRYLSLRSNTGPWKGLGWDLVGSEPRLVVQSKGWMIHQESMSCELKTISLSPLSLACRLLMTYCFQNWILHMDLVSRTCSRNHLGSVQVKLNRQHL